MGIRCMSKRFCVILHVKEFSPPPPEPTALCPTGNRSIGNGPLREDPS